MNTSHASAAPAATSRAPFGDCKNARLQHLSNVQAKGVLIAVHSDSGVIEYCSENSAELLGIQPEDLLGQTGAQWLPDRWPGLSALASREGNLEWQDFEASEPLVVIGHRQGSYQILEFERAASPQQHRWGHASRIRFLEQLTAVHTVEHCRELLVNCVFEQSGYDRVLMYRFLPDWHGEVTYERCRPGVNGFLGLRFPASDIPPNARQIFTINWQRSIADVDSEPSAILQWRESAQPLDLTYSILRSAHPVHIQYLKNMGVEASLTLSMVVNGKLWGLIACHHLSPRSIAIEHRLAFEEMARLASLHLTNLLGLIEQRSESEMRQQLSCLNGAMSAAGGDARSALCQNLATVRRTFKAAGAWIRFEGEDFFAGLTPDALSLAPLRDFLERFPREEISHFNALPAALQPFRALSANASGVLFVPLGSADFLALLRPEVIETVNWAGKPGTSEDQPASTARALSPRSSFAVWSQKLRNNSEPWTDSELDMAAVLRTNLRQFIATSRMEQIALHDPLTGLANRLLFEKRLQQEVRNSMARGSAFAVHMIDLDKFKQVNDTFGHAAGDQLLKQVGDRLTSLAQQSDTVARLGGDEFAILQTGLNDKTNATATAERIVQSVSETYQILGSSVEIGASVGVSVCPSDTVEGCELMEYADLALYEVKRSGRNAYSMYAPRMRKVETRKNNWESVVDALQNNEFHMNYQPIVDARSMALRGLEAFLRWQPKDGAEVAAGEFMPLVEQKLLACAVSEWAMEAVFQQYREWLRQGLPLVPITVNIGTNEFATQDLLGRIEKLAARYDTGWQWLRLDIKEHALLADVGYAIRKLGNLRDAGVSANLDNFGRGFVPLGYLTQLPFRGIKLDGILFEHQSDRQYFNALLNIVQSIAQVSSAQLTVTKIETPEMLEMVGNQRVDLLQGYAISRPGDAAQAAEWLRNPGSLLL